MQMPRRAAVAPATRALLSAGVAALPFSDRLVAQAPQASGVYFLYRHQRLLYIGIAVHGTGIRAELERHLRGLYGERTLLATAFNFEETRHPVTARRDYLHAHMEQHRGRLPACNDPAGLRLG